MNDSGDQVEKQDADDSNTQVSSHDSQDADAETWTALELSPFQEAMFASTLLMTQFFAQARLGQTLSILKVISASFQITNPGELSWLIAGYSLTIGSCILLSRRLGDYFGHKPLFIAGLVCLYGGLTPVGVIGGATISALFAEFVWWPWSYWLMGCITAAVALCGYFAVPSSQSHYESLQPRPSLRDILWATDVPAGALGIAALVFFNLAWNQAVVVGWATPYIPVFLVLGILFAIALFYIEINVSPSPLIPFSILTGDVAFVLACVAAAWGGFGAYVYYFWTTMLMVVETPPLLASAWFSPPIPVGLGTAVLTGYLVARVHPAMLMVRAEACVLAACLLLATFPPGQTYWAQLFPSLIFAPLGLDMSFPAANLVMSNAMGKEHQGMAMSLVNTIVNYSISLSLGIAGTIEQQVTKTKPEGPATDSDFY
ncbi:hypothetical protein A0O28_0109520 [Trichoderma guizhouense]|uniref:MFS permease n=1 Tax=Trichoderma guizhouense TaxID=1491466 RepID=A0A1T3C4Y7_9HYPO|nr:hypothetical protein A0O28_0109520 [Trichoderma guizhouense]